MRALPECPHCDAAATLEGVRVEPRGVIVAWCFCCGQSCRVTDNGTVIHSVLAGAHPRDRAEVYGACSTTAVAVGSNNSGVRACSHSRARAARSAAPRWRVGPMATVTPEPHTLRVRKDVRQDAFVEIEECERCLRRFRLREVGGEWAPYPRSR